MWSIDGLEAGRWALALKMAPAISGGVAGLTAIWRRLLGISTQDDPTTYLRAEPSLGKPPSIGELITDTMRELLENQVTGRCQLGWGSAWSPRISGPAAIASPLTTIAPK